jgi:hypothetical protein
VTRANQKLQEEILDGYWTSDGFGYRSKDGLWRVEESEAGLLGWIAYRAYKGAARKRYPTLLDALLSANAQGSSLREGVALAIEEDRYWKRRST